MMDRIKEYVDEHLVEKLTLRAVAAHCGVSISTVTQMFQRREEITFHDFVTSRRLQKAEDLIRQGIPLEIVGKTVGYRDHSTFYRAFRQHYGISPREYRSALLAGEER